MKVPISISRLGCWSGLTLVALAGLAVFSCANHLPYIHTQQPGEHVEGTYLVTGCVVVTANGHPIGDLVVTLTHRPVTSQEDALLDVIRVHTDSSGYFILPNRVPGDYVLRTVKSLSDQLVIARTVGPHLEDKWVVDVRKLPGGGAMMDSPFPHRMATDSVRADENGVLDFGVTVLAARYDDQDIQSSRWNRWTVESICVPELTAEPLVQEWGYFRECPSDYYARRFPQSGWAPLLKQHSGGRRNWAP